jgi:hypothetical protein
MTPLERRELIKLINRTGDSIQCRKALEKALDQIIDKRGCWDRQHVQVSILLDLIRTPKP